MEHNWLGQTFREHPKTPNAKERKIFMANRLRNERIEIKLTKEEREIFEEKMKMANCKSMSHFLRKCVLEKEIYVVDLEPFRDLQALVGRYNSNLNQIAKRVNSTGIIYSDDIEEIKNQVAHFSKEQWQIHALLLNKTIKDSED